MPSTFPAPAFDDTEMKKSSKDQPDCKLILHEDADKQPPGTLPASSSELSTAARGLLMRLLDRDPRMRMRNLRQLQQSAFFMGFNIEAVKEKKVSPKEILQRCFLDSASRSGEQSPAVFNTFDQPVKV